MQTGTAISRNTLARSRWLGIAVAVWLNLAVQPCAMALGLDSDCPHCPPSDDEQMSAHHGHHSNDVEAGCDPSSGCGDADEFSIDGRSSFSKAKDKFDDDPTVVTPLVAELISPVGYSTTAADPPRTPANSQPLYLINCVFRD